MEPFFKIKISSEHRALLILKQFFGDNLILLDGLGDTLCLFSNRSWGKIVKQYERRSRKDKMDERAINDHLSNFYKSKVETKIDFRGNILVPAPFKNFCDNKELFFTPMGNVRKVLLLGIMSDMLIIGTEPFEETLKSTGNLKDDFQKNPTGNKLIIAFQILEELREYVSDGPPTNKQTNE